MKTVDEIISSWSASEREKFSDLIKECKEREKNINECSSGMRIFLADLDDEIKHFLEVNETLKKESQNLLETCLETLLKISPAGKVPN
jgi:hypothetical protein